MTDINTNINFKNHDVKSYNLLGIGELNNTMNSIFSDDKRKNRFKASDYFVGFGVSSSSLEDYGEGMVVNNLNFYTASDSNNKVTYKKIASGKDFVSANFVLVPKEAKPNTTFTYNGSSPISYYNFIEKLHNHAKQPILFVARVKFKKANGMYVIKPPIYEQNIFEHEKDYLKPGLEYDNKDAFIVGAVADFFNIKDKKIKADMATVLHYDDTLTEESEALSVHTHVLLFDKPINSIKDITSDNAFKVIHLFDEGTIIESVYEGYIYNFTGLDMID